MKDLILILIFLVISPCVFAVNSLTISGKVVDNTGVPIYGATVIVKGSSIGTTTDLDGNFTLIVPEDAAKLLFTYVGYEDIQVEIAGRENINAILSEGVSLIGVTVLGSRGKLRTDVDRPVPIDIISNYELNSTNQTDIGQSLHYIAPSFNAVKFGINELAPLVDPSSLRGLSPDQTLLLINGKRRHKVSFFNLNHGIGKGQSGNDVNSIPTAAIKTVEILRDGAAAQYGSDAIAGVINMELNDKRSGGSVGIYTGTGFSKPKYDALGDNADLKGENIYGSEPIIDGRTFATMLNFGIPWGGNGFINSTLSFHHNEAYDRSGVYSHSDGWYTDDPVEDEKLRTINGVSLDRAILGAAENTNGGFFINAGRPVNEVWDYYAFGGYSYKQVIGGVFSRSPTRTDRSVLEIFPNGYNPEVPSNLSDWQIFTGVKGQLGPDWDLDLSFGNSGNNVDFYNRNTVNPSLGASSPTQFYTGSLKVTQSLLNADVIKSFNNTTLSFGTEIRMESFQQSQGQIESWIAGPLAFREVELLDSMGNVVDTIIEGFKDVGSSGREGFSDRTDGKWFRTNLGLYVEVESELTDDLLVGGAIRFENYSDFGADMSYKVAAKYSIIDQLSVRGSVNRSFRAPALNQLHYSNFSQIAFDEDGNSVVTPFLPIRDELVQQAFGMEELKPEKSMNVALGVASEISDILTISIDVYQVKIEDRIIVSGGIPAEEYTEFSESGYDEINIFTNAVNTNTQGIDFVGNLRKHIGQNQTLNVTLAANFNRTKVDGYNIPDVFLGKESDLIDDRDIVFLTDGTPKQKIILSGNYRVGVFAAQLRVSSFGKVKDSREIDPATNEPQEFRSKIVSDVALTAYFTSQLTCTLGVNNLFDVYPDMLLSPNVRGEVIYSRRTNQFGTQGRFVNLSLNYKWK